MLYGDVDRLAEVADTVVGQFIAGHRIDAH